MRTPRRKRNKSLLCAAALLASALISADARAALVYESLSEFFSSGDFNGDGIPDVLVLDKASGNARVGYSDGNGGLTWSTPLATGVENVTGLGVERFLQPGLDAIALTTPSVNHVSLVDLSQTNSVGTSQTLTPVGIGPHAVVGLSSPLAPPSGGLPFLLIASSLNDSPSERLDLAQWSGAPIFYGLFSEIAPFERLNALSLDTNTPTFVAGLARGTNDALHLWQFTNSPSVWLALSNLPAGSEYSFGNFNGESLPRFIFYQPNGSNLTIVPLVQTNGTIGFGPLLLVPLSEGVQGVYCVGATANGGAIILFGDGIQGLSLPNGTPALSAKYQTGAGAAGNAFGGVVPLTNGMFALFDAPVGNSTSAHAQVLQFDGTNLTQRSASNLPLISSGGTRANVWLFQLEPFVNRSPGFVASLNSPDWADGVGGLPGAVQVSSETDAGAANGLGGATAKNLGVPPGGAAFGIANQYDLAISLFSYNAPRLADPMLATISPPPGSYGSPLAISFSTTPVGSGVQYRVGNSDAWHAYLSSFSITNDVTIQFYGTNASGVRSGLQFAQYLLGTPASGAPAAPVVIDPTNTNTPPVVSTNQLLLSGSGTVFYGRRSAANAGTIWAINLDGSSDTYVTAGVRPRVSKDGRWLAFLREGNPFANQGNVWIRDLQSGNESRIFSNPGYVTGYDWETNDGALLLDYACSIWDLNTNGNLSATLSADCFDVAPVRNPLDGRIVLQNLNPNPAISGLYVANADGSGRLRIVSTVGGASWPAWSPDGSKIVFADRNSTNENSGKNLWVANSDGTGLVQISGFSNATNGFPHGAIWSPDGSALVGAGTIFGTNGLWVIPLTPDRDDCDGPPLLLPTSAGDAIDFAGSVVVSPATQTTISIPIGLFILQDPSAVLIYWNTNFAGATLQWASDLSLGNWTSIPGPYPVNSGYFRYLESKANLQSAKYFRLR